MAEKKRIGLSFGTRTVRTVVLSDDRANAVVDRVDEVDLPFELGPEQLINSSSVERVREVLASHLEDSLDNGATVVLALPADFCRIRFVPVDGELGEDELQEQARWELERGMLEGTSNYNLGVHRIRADVGLTDRLIVVGVRKDLIWGTRRGVAGIAGKLVAIEPDVFSAVRAFAETYQQDPVRPSILLGRRGGICHAVSLTKGDVSGYAAWPISETVGDEPEEIAGFVRDVIDRFVKANEICTSLEEVAAIYMYGEGIGEELLETLRDTFEARVERLNPFQRQRAASTLRDLAAEAHPEAFATAFGAALW